MTLRERLGSWLGRKPERETMLALMERAATDPIPMYPQSAIDFGPGIGNQPSHANLLQESLGIAATATRAIANRIGGLNPQVKVTRRVMDGTTIDETMDDHVLKALLDRPHPNLTRMQLLWLTAQWIVTVGEAYWLKVGSRLGVPMELHPLPPTNVTPLLSGGVVVGYRVQDGEGKPHTLQPDVICRFFFPDPENPFGSEGYLGPEGTTADSLKFAGQHLRRHYQHNAIPPGVLETGADATQFTKDEKERFDHEWVRRYHNRVGQSKGAPPMLPLGYKLVQMAMESGANITPLLEFWRDEQLMGFGVPRSVLGQVVSGDRSSAETNQYVFDRHAVLPIANLIADGITLQVARDFDSKIFVEFEPFVSDDKDFTLAQETADLTNKVRSVNQVREDRGLDPADWGELPVATIGQMPYEPDAFLELEPDMPSALEDEEPEDEEEEPRILPSVKRKRTRAFFSPHNEWQRQIKREKKFVPAFLKAMRTIFRDQMRSVLNKLDEQEEQEEPRARAVNPELLFNPEDWERLFEVRLEPVREAAFVEILRETLAGLGSEELFVFTEQMQKVLKAQGAQLVRQVNATTGKRIAEAVSRYQAEVIAAEIEAGVGAGAGIESIAKRIESVFAVRRKEARTIARTEVLKASQQAQLDAFEAADVEQKQWNTNRDPEVRDSHSYAEGQIREVGDPFDLAGELADAPGIGAGGVALSAANAINCRCFLTPVVED